ncbi:MAG: segregation/condensation protein A [Planctomycetota bacterium]|jgi:segregation and condensation protein A|nr:segregation/condensation protein A [Planctomycetota bacterium]
MSLNVAIPDTFSGPMHLLLELIRREEMDIHDINVARLASAYLEELDRLDSFDMDETAEFLSLASRLLEIKSRILAPPEKAEEEGEDESEDWDPRSGLVEALLEYRRFKEAAGRLDGMAAEQARRHPRLPPPMSGPAGPAADRSIGGLELMLAFQSLLERLASRRKGRDFSLSHREVPISQRIQQITTVLAEAGRARFSLLLSSLPDRLEMVGFFIAMLEMIRQGVLVARQADDFTDIILEAREKPPEPAGRPRRRAPVIARLSSPPARRTAGIRRRAAPVRLFPAKTPAARRRAGSGGESTRIPPPWRPV